jgi:predicted GNAT family N-acyltransferase
MVNDTQSDDIINHQNIVLRYYSLTGMISYADAPAFHTLVKNRDFRIVCVFEVFSQTRCEDDFLENLALIGQILKEQEMQGSHSGSNIMMQSAEHPYQSPQHSSNSGGGVNGARPLAWDFDSD